MNTLEAIHTRRSIRAFTSDPLGDDELNTIVRAAAAAPSGGNAQMWVFIAVREPKRLMALRSLSPGIIARPAAVIVLCLDRRRKTTPEGGLDEMVCFDLGAALQNILLTAHELGLGGCAIGSFNKQGIAALLNLPPAVEPKLLVTIGRPKLIPPAPPKRPLEEVFFEETYQGE